MSQPAKRGRPAWNPPEGVEIDWTRPASHIAKECKSSVHAVIAWMRRNDVPVRPRGMERGRRFKCKHRKAGSIDPTTIDWTRQDIALAKIHGVCRERIRQLRKAAGLPASGSAEWRAAGGVVTNPPHQGRKSKLAVDGQAAVA